MIPEWAFNWYLCIVMFILTFGTLYAATLLCFWAREWVQLLKIHRRRAELKLLNEHPQPVQRYDEFTQPGRQTRLIRRVV